MGGMETHDSPIPVWLRPAMALSTLLFAGVLAVAWFRAPWCDSLGTVLSHLARARDLSRPCDIGYGIALGVFPSGLGTLAGWGFHAWSRHVAGRPLFPSWLLPLLGALSGLAPLLLWWAAATFLGTEG